MTTERRMFHETFISAEGFHYEPFVRMNDGGAAIEVGWFVYPPDGSERREVSLTPSSGTDEGPGHGNVFFNEDGEAVAHVAWEVQDIE